MSHLLRLCVAAVGLFALVDASQAQFEASPQSRKPDINAELIIGGVAKTDPEIAWIGVRVALGTGWKTYWRSPGDAGLPPEFDWSSSVNLKRAEVEWPAPQRMTILGVETIGYTHEVVFPVKIQIEDSRLLTSINLKMTIYACSTICVREERQLTATIESSASDERSRATIDTWRNKVPRSASDVLTVTSIKRQAADPPRLQIKVASTIPFGSLDAFVESDPPVYGDKPQIAFDADGLATLTIAFPGQRGETLQVQSLTATLVNGDKSVVAIVPAETAIGAAGPLYSDKGASGRETYADDPPVFLWSLLATALLGGLILNLMPCVFPVLSLKLLSFVREKNAERRPIRIGFAASAAGIVASFLVLATVLAAMKAAGTTVGWGIQFQQPIFLGAMAIVVSLFAANLLGYFQLALPSALMNGLADKSQGSSVASQFATGFVATLLATPCSAPFVGTAVGFALARGTVEIYLIFAALGVGMASPYLLVAAFPRLAMLLPRPGRWLILIKQLMAAALLGTAAWLLFVLATVAGAVAAGITGGAIALGLFVLRPFNGMPRKAFAARAAAAAGFVIVAIAAVSYGVRSTVKNEEIPWRPFSREEVQSLVQSGGTVFVDITAAWCVTCKVNKAFVIESPEIVRRLASDIIPVQGDWTKPNDGIAQFLKAHGRYGLPFNVVFGPAAPDGIILPELLSKATLSAAFDQATAKSLIFTTVK